jgi:hypothetical protein
MRHGSAPSMRIQGRVARIFVGVFNAQRLVGMNDPEPARACLRARTRLRPHDTAIASLLGCYSGIEATIRAALPAIVRASAPKGVAVTASERTNAQGTM